MRTHLADLGVEEEAGAAHTPRGLLSLLVMGGWVCLGVPQPGGDQVALGG